MEAKELMIGDWCILGNGQYAQIDTVLFKMLLEYEIDGNKNKLRPIPLTPEILEKNGIPTNGDTFYFDADEDCKLVLIYESNKLHWSINCAEYLVLGFEYVHELQHAIRLCGLNELADNFILE